MSEYEFRCGRLSIHGQAFHRLLGVLTRAGCDTQPTRRRRAVSATQDTLEPRTVTGASVPENVGDEDTRGHQVVHSISDSLVGGDCGSAARK